MRIILLLLFLIPLLTRWANPAEQGEVTSLVNCAAQAEIISLS